MINFSDVKLKLDGQLRVDGTDINDIRPALKVYHAPQLVNLELGAVHGGNTTKQNENSSGLINAAS